MADEEVFLSDGQLYISSAKITLHGTTYATATITSVAKRVTPPERGCAIFLLVGGLVSFLVGLAILVVGVGPCTGGSMIAGLFLGVLCSVTAVIWLRSFKPTYHVVIASSGPEAYILSSPDQALVDRVINAITSAINQRG